MRDGAGGDARPAYGPSVLANRPGNALLATNVISAVVTVALLYSPPADPLALAVKRRVRIRN
jgi:hypothetical protein